MENKTFEYLDEIVARILVLEGLETVIQNWENGEHTKKQERYEEVLLEYEFSVGSTEEEYVFWKCHGILQGNAKTHITSSGINLNTTKLKADGYV